MIAVRGLVGTVNVETVGSYGVETFTILALEI